MLPIGVAGECSNKTSNYPVNKGIRCSLLVRVKFADSPRTGTGISAFDTSTDGFLKPSSTPIGGIAMPCVEL